jgi:hypothetical protein
MCYSTPKVQAPPPPPPPPPAPPVPFAQGGDPTAAEAEQKRRIRAVAGPSATMIAGARALGQPVTTAAKSLIGGAV